MGSSVVYYMIGMLIVGCMGMRRLSHVLGKSAVMMCGVHVNCAKQLGEAQRYLCS